MINYAKTCYEYGAALEATDAYVIQAELVEKHKDHTIKLTYDTDTGDWTGTVGHD